MDSLEDFAGGNPASPAAQAQSSQPETEGSDLASWASGDQDTQKLGLSYKMGIGTPTDKAAKVLRLAGQTGLPQDFIERNADDLEGQVQKQNFDPAQFQKTSPAFAQWLSEHPNNVAAAKDDLDKLNYVERQWRNVTNQFKKGELQMELTDIGTKAIDGTATQDDRVRQAQIEQEMSNLGDYGIKGPIESVPGIVSNMLPMQGRTLWAGAKMAAPAAAAGAAIGSVEPGLGTMVGATAAGAPAFDVGSALEIARQESSLAYLDYEKMKDDKGMPLDRDTALGAATIVGGVNGALGLIPFENLTKSMPVLRNFSRDGVKQLLASPTVRGAFMQYAKQVGQHMAEGGGIGYLQQIVRNAGATISDLKSKGQLQNMSTGQLLDQIFSDQNMQKAKEMGVMGVQAGAANIATGALDLRQNLSKARQADVTSQAFQSIGQTLSDTKLHQMIPEKTQDLLSRMTKDTPNEFVYLPPETWNQYWQSKNVDPRAVATDVLGGDPQAYDEAMRTGQDIQVPTDAFGAKIAPSEHGEFFAQEARTAPGEMNAREATEYRQSYQKMLSQIDSGEGDKFESLRGSSQKVYEDVYQQLKTAGFEDGDADAQAKMYRDFFGVQGLKEGLDPAAMYDKYRLSITRGENEPESAGESLEQKEKPPVTPEQAFSSPDALDRYKALPETKDGMVISQDAARHLYEPYAAGREGAILHLDATSEHAEKFAQAAFEQRLKQPGDAPVIFLAGGTASGKTAFRMARGHTWDGSTAVVDSTGSNFNVMKSNIDKALAAGKPAQVSFIYRPFNLALDGNAKRFAETGRLVPPHKMAHSHVAAIETFQRLKEAYKNDPRVHFEAHDNSGLNHEPPKAMPVDEMNALRYNQGGESVNAAVKSLKADANKRLKNELEEVRKTQERYLSEQAARAAEIASGADRQTEPNSDQVGLEQRQNDVKKFDQSAALAPSPPQSPLGFYSQLEHEISKMDFKQIPAKDLASRIKNIQGIKAEEIEWTGLNDYLKAKEQAGEKVTKEEVSQFLRENGVKVEQVVKGDGEEISGADWSEPERDNSGDSDDISNEMYYYTENPEEAFGKETIDEWRAEIEKEYEGNSDRVKEEALNEKIRDEAEKRATEYVESDDYHGARYSVEEQNTGYNLHGSDEIGWYSPDMRAELGGNLEEAKIKLLAHLIEKGKIEGKQADLVRENDIKWKEPRAAVAPGKSAISRRANQLIKNDFARLEKEIRERYSYAFDEEFEKKPKAAQEKKIAEYVSDQAREEAEAHYDDHTNPKNKVRVSIDHPILSGHIEGNDKNGYKLNYESEAVENNRHDLEAKNLEDAKKESVQKMIAAGDVKPSGSEMDANEVNKISGSTKWGKYVVPGGENYREVLLTLPNIGPDKFQYTTHFNEKNILAHVRLTDRVDAEGRKTLFIEELQSDWHQQGREKGYSDKGALAPLEERHSGLYEKLADISKKLKARKSQLMKEAGENPDKYRALAVGDSTLNELMEQESANEKEHLALQDQIDELKKGVPNAPFKNTDAWAALALKRMLRMAAEQGYQALAWSPAEVHVDRWGTDNVSWVKKEGGDRLEVSHDPQGERYTVVPVDQAHGRPVDGGAFHYGEQSGSSLTKETALERAKEFAEKGNQPHFLVGSAEQRGGNADGMNIEELARMRGELLERRGERVTTKEELQQVIADTLGREHNLRSLESLTERVWKRMQGEDEHTGAVEPRKEGMQSFYDKMVPDAMKKILKKLDPEAKIEVGKINAISGDEDHASKQEYAKSDRGMKSLEVPITDKLKDKLMAGQSLFQPGQGEDGARGRIRFNPARQFNIQLLQNADMSTFLHETGHFYLEVLGDLAESKGGSEQVKSDYQKILNWFGVDKREDIKTEHHEMFARGFERYLMEGKAPSAELRGPFSRFRDWLAQVYQHVKNLDVELNPEVRDVFDRMLATDDQIRAAQHEQGATPLFSDPRAIGMSDEEAAKYKSAIAEAHTAATQKLEREVMKDVMRERQKRFQGVRERTREEVANYVDQQPEQLALSVLQKGKLPDGSDLPPEMSAIKLSRQAIVDQFGEERLKELPKPYVYSKEGGAPPDFAAALFGFGSGDELLSALSKAQNRNDLIETMTDARMAKEHGDILKDGRLPVEAMKAIHNDRSAEVKMRELEHLASDNLPAFKGLINKVGRRLPKLDEVRKQAEDIISAKKARELNPLLYQRAEAKASNEARAQLLRGDFHGAFEAKQRELLAHELYRAATKARDEVDSMVDYMGKFNRPSIREKLAKARGEYLPQIDAILDRYDFKRSVPLKEVDKRKSLLQFVQDQQKQGYDLSIPEKVMLEAGKQHYKDTSVGDLRDVRDSVETIEHLANLSHQLIANQKTRDLDEARQGIIASIKAHHTMTEQKPDFAPDFKARTKEVLAKAVASHTRLEFLFEHLDGYKPHGPVWETLFKPFADAENEEHSTVHGITGELSKIFGAYSRIERAKWFINREFIPEIGTHMTKANLLAVALNWGNEYNRDALMKGHGWSEMQVNALLKRLDARDWKTVQGIWDYLDTFWPQIAAQEKELNGIAPEKVEATPFSNEHGEFRGGYYPIVFDGKMSWRQSMLNDKESTQELFGGSWARAMTKKGHTVERENTGGKPLLLNLTGLTNHLTNVAHDLAFRRPLIDVSKIMSSDEVKDAMQSAVGREAVKLINPWLNAIANDRRSEPANPMEQLLGRARMGATVVNLGLKMTSALVHALGYSLVVKEVGAGYALQGLHDTYLRPWKIKEQWGFVTDRSQMMKNRSEEYDRDVRDMMKRMNVAGISQGPGSMVGAYTHEMRKAFMSLTGYMDLAVSLPTWLSAYRKAMDGGLENVKSGDEPGAIDYADQIVRQTKSAAAAKDLAAIQRGPEAWKLFTMFYSVMGINFNQFQKTINQFRMDKNVPRLLGGAALTWFVPAVLDEVIRGRAPDQDADQDDWAKWLGKKIAAYPFNSIVLVRDIVSALEHGDYSGSPALEAVNNMVHAAKAGTDLATGQKDELTKKDTQNVLDSVGYVTGLPTKQSYQTLDYLYDWMNGDQQPDNPAKGIWQAFVTGKRD